MKKIVALILTLVFAFAIFTGCAGANTAKVDTPVEEAPAAQTESTPEAQEEPKESFTLVLATSINADAACVQAMETFGENIARESEGRLTLEIYPDSSLIQPAEEASATRSGQIDIFFGAGSLIQDVSPWASVVDAPYVIESYDHLRTVMDGDIGDEWKARILEENGLRVLDCFYFGSRQLNLVDIGREVRTPEDLAGVKLRVPGIPLFMALGKGLGANPTPLALGEVYVGLETGVIDGQDNPLAITKARNFQEVTKYIILTNHNVSILSPMMNEAKFQQLDEELQEIILRNIKIATQQNDEAVLAEEENLVTFFEEAGLTVIKDPDIAAFKASVFNVLFNDPEYADISKDWDMDLFDRIVALAPSNQK